MAQKEVHENGSLVLQVYYDGSKVLVAWQGESDSASPREFIDSIMARVYRKEPFLPLEFDFTKLNYMNSSTIPPIVKQIEKARKSGRKLVLRYDKELKWQELSFSALEVFQIAGLIEVLGE
jgi:hypothetical protein